MQLLFRLGILAAAWLGSIIGLILVLPLGLIVAEWLIFPLALVIAALLAALGAGWTGTFLARDQTRTNLVPVISLTEAVAVGVALIFLMMVRLGMASFGPLIFPAVIFSLILTLSASAATWRFRHPKQASGGEVKLTVILLVLAVVSVPGVIFLASLFGLAGA
ncbi:MAG: hypothetical protein KJ077_41660 [Anaerolineae bacterium]|nr:hypothetical protein [Anaerolineae bacterium]